MPSTDPATHLRKLAEHLLDLADQVASDPRAASALLDQALGRLGRIQLDVYGLANTHPVTRDRWDEAMNVPPAGTRPRRFLILMQAIEGLGRPDTCLLKLNALSPGNASYTVPALGVTWTTSLLGEFPDEAAARNALHHYAHEHGWKIEQIQSIPDWCEQWKVITHNRRQLTS